MIPSRVIQFDKRTGSLKPPTLILRTRTGVKIDKIPFENLQVSFVGVGIDEISFDVHKKINGKEYKQWDKLIDLAIVDYVGYGWFEIHPTLNEDIEDKKTCVCKALENELAQRNLYDFHINDEDAILLSDEPEFTPTTLCNFDDPAHSLIHRALSSTPHWTVGYVSPYFNINGNVYERNNIQREFSADGRSIYDFFVGDVAKECSCVFTFGDYTSEGYKRVVNCLNLEECVYLRSNMKVQDGYTYRNGQYYDENGELLANQKLYGYCEGAGIDTNIFVSKNKLAKSFSRDSDDGSIKNTFKVSGGDDFITGMFPSVTATGTSYITMFGNFQYEDMGVNLTDAIQTYESELEDAQEEYVKDGGVYVLDSSCTYDPETNTCYDKDHKVLPTAKVRNNMVYIIDPLSYYEDGICYDKDGNKYNQLNAFYVKPGLYTEYCQLVDRLNYLEHDKFPSVYPQVPTLQQVKTDVINHFSNTNNKVLVMLGYDSSTDSSFDTITNTIESVIKTVVDYRFDFKILNDDNNQITCTDVNQENIGQWNANIKIIRTSKSYDLNDPAKEIIFNLTVYVRQTLDNENIDYCKQKMNIAIAKDDIVELDISRIDIQTELENHLKQYNLTSLKTFRDSFEACASSLTDWYSNLGIEENDPEVSESALISRDAWVQRKNIANKVYDEMFKAVSNLKDLLSSYEGSDGKLAIYQTSWQLHNWLINRFGGTLGEEYWLQYNSYIREDTYNNPNYISDGLTDSEILYKCKELYGVAKRELSKACNIQYKINGSLNNIFALEELNALHDTFGLFNYIRCRVDDKIYKLRLIEIKFSDQNPENIDVTFSDQITDVTGVVSDIKSILAQSKSMASSYDATVKQSKQGVKAMSTFNSLQQEGLDSALYLIKNSPEQVMTFDKKGLLGRTMLDEGVYSNDQAIYTANGVYFTRDAFNSVNTAIGKFKYNNQWVYGINAEYVLGKIIAGESLSISNETGSVQITGGGIRLKGGSIEWIKDDYPELPESSITNLVNDLAALDTTANQALQDARQGIADAAGALARANAVDTAAQGYANTAESNAKNASDPRGSASSAESNAKTYADNKDSALSTALTSAYQNYTDTAVANLDTEVGKYLGLGGTTIVSDTYLVSPYIGGGYLNITNGQKQVIIDPKNLGNTNYIFAVKNGSEFTVGIKADGTTNIKGGITATSLTITDQTKVTGMKIPKTYTYAYANSTTNSQPADSAFSSTQNPEPGKYMWIRTTISYTDSTITPDKTYYSTYIGKNGTDGTNGISVSKMRLLYGVSDSSSTEPTTFSTSRPSTITNSQFVWTRCDYMYSNKTTWETGTPVYDPIVTSECKSALVVVSDSTGVTIHPLNNTADYMKLTDTTLDFAINNKTKAHFGTDGIWIGGSATTSATSTNYAFKVDSSGNGYFSGELKAATGSFSGTISAAAGEFTKSFEIKIPIGKGLGWEERFKSYSNGFEVGTFIIEEIGGVAKYQNFIRLLTEDVWIHGGETYIDAETDIYIRPNRGEKGGMVYNRGDFYCNGDLFCGGYLKLSNSYYINDTTQGICTNGCLGVNGYGYTGYALGVDGNTYLNGNLQVTGTGVIKQLNDGGHLISIGWSGSELQVVVDSTRFRIETTRI